MGATLKDIAEVLGLSMTTISWVIAGKGDEKNISKATQKRIMDCLETMPYEPNLIARSLNTGMSKTLGLIVPSIGDRFYSQIAEEIELEAEKYGYTIMVCSSESQLDRENRMIQTLRAKQVDGIIMAPTESARKEVQGLLDDNFPFVLFDLYFADLATNYVIIDNESCSYKLVKHLIEKGCKKIALITTNPHLLTLKQRSAGYKRAHEQSGLIVNPDLNGIVEYVNYEQDIVKILDGIFDKVPDVDGFFFLTHILAIEALIYFYEHKIEVDQFELACIHEISAFRAMAPKMHTAKMPVKAIGQEVIKILLKEIKDKNNKDVNMGIQSKRATILSSTIHFRD